MVSITSITTYRKGSVSLEFKYENSGEISTVTIRDRTNRTISESTLVLPFEVFKNLQFLCEELLNWKIKST